MSTGKPHSLSLLGESVLRLTYHHDMTIAIGWDVKPQSKQANIRDCNSIFIFWKFSQVYFKLVLSISKLQRVICTNVLVFLI